MKKEITLTFGGDVMLARSFNKIFKENPEYDVWGNGVKEVIKSSNLFIFNLEMTITNNLRMYPKTFNYKLDPKYFKVPFEPLSGKGVCSLANNHSFDYYKEGLIDTMNALKRVKIKFTGAGINLNEAKRLVLIDVKGIKVGLLSAANHYSYWAATDKTPGIWYINPFQDYSSTLAYVKKCSQKCDFLIFSCHMQPNYVNEVDRRIKEFFRSLIDVAGVNVVHGHSPHHLLPIETYKGGLIMYSLGDLIDDYAVDLQFRNDLAALITLNVGVNGINIKTVKRIPTKNFHKLGKKMFYFNVNVLDNDDDDHYNVLEMIL